MTEAPVLTRDGTSASGRRALVVQGLRAGNWRYTIPVIFVFFALVQLLSYAFPPYLFPNLLAIGDALVEIYETGLPDLQTTAVRFVVGLLCGAAAGWALALLMGANRTVGGFGEAFFKIIMSMPALSWMLLVVLWFRTVELRIFFVVFVLTMPFYVVGVYETIRGMDKEQVDAVQQFRPSKFQNFRLLLMPATVPAMITTTKQVSGLILRMVVFAELIGATSGVGYAMATAQSSFRIDLLLAWSVVLIVANYAVLGIVDLIESRVLRWRPKHESNR